MAISNTIVSILTKPKHSLWIAPLLVLADAVLSALIIKKVPCTLDTTLSLLEHRLTPTQTDTEIDWTTYMQHIALYQAGERDYTVIKGDTGPLVYPAGHVYIYSFLYELTNKGQDIALGQYIFAGIYIATLIVVLSCYIKAGAPPYLLPLLVLSKRLHSVYMLRLFNDGIATLAMWLAILFFQQRQLAIATTIWSLGVGVKMSLLLLAPGVAIVVALSGGIWAAVPLALNAVLTQVSTNYTSIEYFDANFTGATWHTVPARKRHWLCITRIRAHQTISL